LSFLPTFGWLRLLPLNTNANRYDKTNSNSKIPTNH
jgi:hypothetical protein